MNVANVIERLRSNAASFSQQVYGLAELYAADFETKEGTSRPCAFVTLSADDAQNGTGEIGITPDIVEQFAVVLCLSNTTDDDGQAAQQSVHALRDEVFGAILNWSPESGYLPVQYVGGRFLAANRVTYLYQLSFSAIRIGGSILEYEVSVRLALDGTRTLAQVLGDISAKVATTTGGTRLADDYLVGREAIPASATRFRLRGIATVLGAIDANSQRSTLTVVLNVLRHLGATDAERTYSEGAMQSAVSALIEDSYWFSANPLLGIPGVFSIIDSPTVAQFPADVERRV
jgi:hypothetical protein